MAMEASKGDILAGFQKLFGNIFIPALQKQEVIVFYEDLVLPAFLMLATLFSLASSNLNIKNYFTFKACSYTSFPFFRIGVSCQVTLGKCKSSLSPLKSLLAF